MLGVLSASHSIFTPPPSPPSLPLLWFHLVSVTRMRKATRTNHFLVSQFLFFFFLRCSQCQSYLSNLISPVALALPKSRLPRVWRGCSVAVLLPLARLCRLKVCFSKMVGGPPASSDSVEPQSRCGPPRTGRQISPPPPPPPPPPLQQDTNLLNNVKIDPVCR